MENVADKAFMLIARDALKEDNYGRLKVGDLTNQIDQKQKEFGALEVVNLIHNNN